MVSRGSPCCSPALLCCTCFGDNPPSSAALPSPHSQSGSEGTNGGKELESDRDWDLEQAETKARGTGVKCSCRMRLLWWQ